MPSRPRFDRWLRILTSVGFALLLQGCFTVNYVRRSETRARSPEQVVRAWVRGDWKRRSLRMDVRYGNGAIHQVYATFGREAASGSEWGGKINSAFAQFHDPLDAWEPIPVLDPSDEFGDTLAIRVRMWKATFGKKGQYYVVWLPMGVPSFSDPPFDRRDLWMIPLTLTADAVTLPLQIVVGGLVWVAITTGV